MALGMYLHVFVLKCNRRVKGDGLEVSMGALNLQGIEFARKGGGNCKERNIQGKAPQFTSV